MIKLGTPVRATTDIRLASHNITYVEKGARGVVVQHGQRDSVFVQFPAVPFPVFCEPDEVERVYPGQLR